MLVGGARCQGLFGALLAPSALSLLTTTFTDAKERGKAFGVFGAIAGAGGAVGLLLGGLLTEYLSWRWCLYVNLLFAAVAAAGAVLLLRQPAVSPAAQAGPAGCAARVGRDVLHSSTASRTPRRTAGTRRPPGASSPRAPCCWPFSPGGRPGPRTRCCRCGSCSTATAAAPTCRVLIAGSGMFGIFLFLTYYMQGTLGFSPVVTGVAFLPMIALVVVFANVSNVVLMPRVGPRPPVVLGMLLAAGAMAWLTRIGVDSGYASAVLPPLLVAGAGLGLVVAPSINTGTFGVAPSDAGVASASVNTGQQLGGSIGTALLNTLAASATAQYLAAHLSQQALSGGRPSPELAGLALVHGYDTAFWWSAAVFAGGAVIAALLLRRGPLAPRGGHGQPGTEAVPVPEAQAVRS